MPHYMLFVCYTFGLWDKTFELVKKIYEHTLKFKDGHFF